MNTTDSKNFQTLHESVAKARANLDDQSWYYITGGSDTETTLRQNRVALDSLALRPRVLNDVSDIDCTAELFGTTCRLPVFMCPVGSLESFNPIGANAVADAANAFGVPMILSSSSGYKPTDLLKDNGSLTLISQLYVRDDTDAVDRWVEHCMQLDMPAFCITVDTAIYGRRERDIAAGFVKPWRANSGGDAARYQASLNWKDIERIRTKLDRPLVLKGIATREDALLAIEHGVDVIYVSNHGGRQLDHSVSSMASLVEVADAVGGRATVLVDSGFRRGTDIVKALALGADGVGLGRLMCYALAAAGADGVVRMLELLEIEYRMALGLLGVRSAAELNRSHVTHTNPLNHQTDLISAFPLLEDIELKNR